MSPYIIFKKTSDLNVTLLKNGMTINLPYEQVAHGYSLGKRIFWFFSGCLYKCFKMTKSFSVSFLLETIEII